MKPVLIGITCNYLDPLPSAFQAGIGAKEQDWQLIAQDYLNAVWGAGAMPVLIPVDRDEERSLNMLEMVDGLLISGGNDVSPSLYRERIMQCGTLDPIRDRMETLLLKKALEMDMPILGICRGIQLMNAALGGTLYQDVVSAGFFPHSIAANKRNIPAHSAVICEGGILEKLWGAGEYQVNSFHHQAVKELAEPLFCEAKSEDGIVEACSVPGKRFVLAVQWHPEMMYDSQTQQKLFLALVEACKRKETK